MGSVKIERALLSVSDKEGLVPFARFLADKGIELLSTGGTYKLLKENGVPVNTVDSYTGHPEIMDGRVKTLHPRVHGGILAVRDNPAHVAQMEQNGIKPIDLVVVNLYPFRQTIAKENVTIDEAIENIDIGGPTMVRSSAKNHKFVTIVVDPGDYRIIQKELEVTGAVSFDTRKALAVKAYRHTADYDAAIDAYLSKVYLNEKIVRLSYGNGMDLRYGENPHQKATFYKDNVTKPKSSISAAKQHHGKELSYNNILDTNAALEAMLECASVPCAVIVKHANPCGYATAGSIDQALEAAWFGDPVSAFGGIIALSRTVDEKTAAFLKGKFVEVIIAPDFTPEALELLKDKSSTVRLLSIGEIESAPADRQEYRFVTGGVLVQDRDNGCIEKFETVTSAQFPKSKVALAHFAMSASKYVKSNAIVLAEEYQEGLFRIVGIGAGQPNRVDSLKKLALTKAVENFSAEAAVKGIQLSEQDLKNRFKDIVLASDAFFPFADSIEAASAAGIRFIVEPGGSRRDSEVIEACNKSGISMVFTGMRHFKH